MISKVANKYLVLFFILNLVQCAFTCNRAIAQDIDLAWVKQVGGTGEEGSASITVDVSGNIYTCGSFVGTGDFDPGPAVFNLTSNGGSDIFITKFDPSGNFIWAKSMGDFNNDQAASIAVDATGNVYTSGFFFATVDFDPGTSTYNLTSFGQWDIFVLKLNTAGNFIWAKQMGGTDYDLASSLVLDAAGNVYTTGEFVSTVADFDPGPGVFNLTTFGNVDIFISKLDAAGNFVWVKQIGGNSIDRGNSITIDGIGNIYVTGDFFGANADFDPGVGTYNMSSFGAADIFVLKLDNTGNFAWAKHMGGSNTEQGNAITIDNAGNVYTTGYFLASGDYDPGSGTFTLSSAGSSGIFISKLDATGNFVWARQFSGITVDPRTNSGVSIAVDANQNVYTTGGFVNTVDFDPGTGTYNLNSLGEWDIFISVFNNAGNFVSVKHMGGSSFDYGGEIIIDGNDNIFTTGYFRTTVDFDPCTGIFNLNAVGIADFFIEKFARPSISINTTSATICSGATVTFTATITNSGLSPSYQWKVNGINVGISSTNFTSSILNNNDQVSCVLTSNPTCVPPITATSNVIAMVVNPSVTPSVTIATASTTICTGISVTFTATPINPGNSPVYQWQINGVNVGTNSPVFTSNILVNNDVVKVLMTNNVACASPNTATSNSLLMLVNTTIAPSITISASTNNICPGVPVTFSAIPANTGTTTSYQWKLNGNDVGTNNLNYILNNPVNNDKIYCIMNTVTSCSSNPISFSDTITMIVKAVPVITFNPSNASIPPGGSIQLNAAITGSYTSLLWTPATGLNNSSILNPVASPLATTSYNLTVFATNNCNADKTLTVTVNKNIYIPNTFTPNGDGLNDIFRIPPGTSFNLQRFSIYNRYGNLVFNTTDINKGWNGTLNGTKSPVGNYIYIIKGIDTKGEVLIKGSVILVR
jgi:gliding motility-associated-like protein